MHPKPTISDALLVSHLQLPQDNSLQSGCTWSLFQFPPLWSFSLCQPWSCCQVQMMVMDSHAIGSCEVNHLWFSYRLVFIYFHVSIHNLLYYLLIMLLFVFYYLFLEGHLVVYLNLILFPQVGWNRSWIKNHSSISSERSSVECKVHHRKAFPCSWTPREK